MGHVLFIADVVIACDDCACGGVGWGEARECRWGGVVRVRCDVAYCQVVVCLPFC